MRFINPKTNEILYDTNMMRELLGVSKSQLKRGMVKYNFSEDEFIKYKNQFLFKENSVINFIEFLLNNKFVKDIEEIKLEVNKIKRLRNGFSKIKTFE